MRFRSYKTKLQMALLLLGLGAIALTGWEASEGATSALRAATYDRLTALRETKTRQIERYFEDIANHVLALSSDESAIAALEQFQDSLPSLPVSAVDRPALQRRYEELYAAVLARTPAFRARIEEWFPSDPVTLAIQQFFLTRDPLQLAAPRAGLYSEVHARYHPTFHRYLSAFHFYDIFLITADGRIVYTVAKEIDLGVRLTESPYRETTLASAWRRALALPEPETFVIEDFAPYLPSNLAPAAFVAAPVYRAGVKIGVLAIQLSIADINRMMTANGRWTQEGLGRTGQAYLIGNNGTLRSDLRQELERPEAFYETLRLAGTPPELIERIRSYRTAVLNLEVPRTGTDFRGVEVLRTQMPVKIPGLNWTMVAEIEAEEALAPVRALYWRILWQSMLIALVLFIAAHFLARQVTKPLLRLASSARRLGQRDFSVRSPVESEDEVGRLAAAFNTMAEDLERTTVSKHELDRILASLINVVFVVDTYPNASVDDVLDSPLRQMNRAGEELLLPNTKFGDLIPSEDVATWRERIGRVLRGGPVHAEDAALCTRQGSRVPVLFSASWLADEAGTRPGLVCVAQNITERKAAEDKLRRMSKVFMDSVDPIVVADAEGMIADCNPEAERTYGWPADELIGREIVTVFPELAGLLRRCLAGEPVRNVETVQTDRGGRRIPVLVTLSLLTAVGGETAGVAVIAEDISDLYTLTGRLIKAQEEERSRLARELHDDLTQRLAAVAIEAGRLEKLPRDGDDRWRNALDRIKRQMAEMSDEVHGLSRRLHPSTLDDLGLVAAIESECRAFFERTGVPVNFAHDEPPPQLSEDAQLGVYRIVQEALRNIRRHADADEIEVGLRSGRLTIRDNGRGFDPASQRRSGIGLASMEERARLLGGSFAVRSAPGEGTLIEVALPHEETQNSASR